MFVVVIHASLTSFLTDIVLIKQQSLGRGGNSDRCLFHFAVCRNCSCRSVTGVLFFVAVEMVMVVLCLP